MALYLKQAVGQWFPWQMRSPDDQFVAVGGVMRKAARYLLSLVRFAIQRMSAFADSLAEKLPMFIAGFGRRLFALRHNCRDDSWR